MPSAYDAWAAQERIPADARLFSNGTEHLMWMEANCFRCRYYPPDASATPDDDPPACMVEYAVCLHGCGDPMPVRLAEVAGVWPIDVGVIGSCRWRRDEDDDGPDPRVPPANPDQLDLLDPRTAPAPVHA